jgi:hypothetical protein
MIYAIRLILLALLPAAASGVPEVCDPALAALFTPARPRLGRYEVCVVQAPIESGRPNGPKYGEIEYLEPLDAFGTAGGYDRSRLAQLYGGRRVAVLRGWRQSEDDLESITALSPYPDASLTRLQTGTMIIRWIGPRDAGSP